MQQTVLALSLASVLCACSSPPKVVTPGGQNRVPINGQAALSQWSAQTPDQEAAESEARKREALEATVAALQRQVADLKTYIILKATESDINTPKGLPAGPPKVEVTKPPPKLAPSSKWAPESFRPVEIKESAISFTVNHPYAKTSFDAPKDIQDALLRAAKASQFVEVRGRTDAFCDNPVDRHIAYQRARLAFNFLVKNGVPSKKIRVTFKGAGHFAVDNSSKEGQARNRRVEIETVGLDTTTFKQGA